MHIYPKRASLDGLEIEMFKLVSYSATPKQWKEWLRVPLEHAAAQGNLELFNKMLRAGANGSAGWRGCRDRTLLDAAAVGGNEEVVSGLLRVGAQPDVKVVSCSSKRSALYTAPILGHAGVARKLVFVGAEVNFADPARRNTVLHEAVRGGHDQLVSYLLLAGASVDVGDEYGSTPLHIAASNGLDGIISDLVFKGADKDARDHRGDSPLMCAAQHGHLSATKTLFSSDANLSFRCTGYHRRSALDYAAEEGHVCIVQAIIDHGVDVNSSYYGFTALHVAARADQEGAVHALIEAGAKIEGKDTTKWTPLAVAAFSNRRKAMLALLQRGANVNARGQDGWTPLHALCFDEPVPGVQALVDLLLRWGADETALDTHGQTILDMLEEASGEASEGEIENVRVLLARAPADRAWRRRGWLVMLRSRASKPRTIGYGVGGGSDSNGGGGSNGTGDGEGEGHKVERREDTGGASHTASEEACSGDGGAEGGVSNLSSVVALLLGLAMEGVFRTVVGYL